MKIKLQTPNSEPEFFTADQLKIGEIAIDEMKQIVQLCKPYDYDTKYLLWLDNGLMSSCPKSYTVRRLRDDEKIVITNK